MAEKMIWLNENTFDDDMPRIQRFFLSVFFSQKLIPNLTVNNGLLEPTIRRLPTNLGLNGKFSGVELLDFRVFLTLGTLQRHSTFT